VTFGVSLGKYSVRINGFTQCTLSDENIGVRLGDDFRIERTSLPSVVGLFCCRDLRRLQLTSEFVERSVPCLTAEIPLRSTLTRIQIGIRGLCFPLRDLGRA